MKCQCIFIRKWSQEGALIIDRAKEGCRGKRRTDAGDAGDIGAGGIRASRDTRASRDIGLII